MFCASQTHFTLYFWFGSGFFFHDKTTGIIGCKSQKQVSGKEPLIGFVYFIEWAAQF